MDVKLVAVMAVLKVALMVDWMVEKMAGQKVVLKVWKKAVCLVSDLVERMVE